jgi:indolepyruvate ferredoxin oxidoreductase beta subunit
MVKSDILNLLFCGTGGQGVLTASEVCGWAAIFEGYHVKKSEVHGMAQRGGSVESHLRFGKKVYSPLIPKGKADFLISFHRDEQLRLKYFLKPKGIDLLAALEIAQNAVPDKKYVNIFILGVLSQYLRFKEQSWLKAIEKVFLNKNLEDNKRLFKEGQTLFI